MGENAFHGIEPGLADTGGQSEYGGLQHAADTVAAGGGTFNGIAHRLSLCLIQCGKRKAVQLFQIRGQVCEGRVFNTGTAGDVRADDDPLCLQRGNHDSRRRNERSGDPAAEMAAAAIILKTVILGESGEIRVAGAGRPPLIIPAAGIRVGDQDGQGRTGGAAFKDTADDTESIGFLPGSGDPSGGTAKRQAGGNEGFIHGQAGRQSVDDSADLRAVAFAEEGDGNGRTEGVFHTGLLINSSFTGCYVMTDESNRYNTVSVRQG